MTVANDPALLKRLTDALAAVPGVRAVVLGGSRARGIASERSDYDIGLYYDAATPLDIATLRVVVATLDDRSTAAEITEIGNWGPWINGGGWLTIGGTQVDLLYRDLVRVQAVVDECRAGEVACYFQPGHPHGFVTAIYAAEIAVCVPLTDPHGDIARLKALTTPYPEKLRQALTKKFIWEAQFALDNARHGRAGDDINYVNGCCFRAIASLCQVICAANGEYLLNEKGAVAVCDRLAHRPRDFAARVETIYRTAGAGLPAPALDVLDGLVEETGELLKTP
jgi:predicted nucleotidyltransferase